jgi:hypothetical protein
MTEQQFSELLKNLASLTEEKKILWVGDIKNGYELSFGESKIILRNHPNVGIVLNIMNIDGKMVARVSNTNIPASSGTEFFKSSIPNYIWQIIQKQTLRTDETLENLLNKLRDFKS